MNFVEMIFNEYSYTHFENTRSSRSKYPDNILNFKGYSKNNIYSKSEQMYNSSETLLCQRSSFFFFFFFDLLENTQNSNFPKILQALCT